MDNKTFAAEIEDIIVQNQNQTERYNSRLGLKLLCCDVEQKTVDYIFETGEWCLNPYGGIHGGVICSLFDTGMGIGAVAISQKMVSTADISVSYLKPMTGKRYRFSAEYTHIGKRMIRCMGRAVDAETGQLCATAMASFVTTEAKAKGLQV